MRQVLMALTAAVMVPAAVVLGGTSRSTAAPPAGVLERCVPSATPGAAGQVRNEALTLVTGEHVRVTTGPSGTTASPAGPGSSAFVRFERNGDEYLVPDEAVPFLGSVLDPRLFDVSYLVRAGLDDARTAATPVMIGYRSGHASLPGQRVTRTITTLAKSQAATLGRLLASDWRLLHAGRRLPPADPLRGIDWIGLPQSRNLPPLPTQTLEQPGNARTTAPPRYHTLTIKFIGTDGKPGAAVGWAQNLDDPGYSAFEVQPLQGNPIIGQSGPVKLSVPDGNYSLQFSLVSPHAGTTWGVDAALVADPQISVTGDTTVTLDARTAKPYGVAITPAVPDKYQVDEFNFSRVAGGQRCDAVPFTLGMFNTTAGGAAQSRMLATPTAPVRDGAFRFLASTEIYPGSGTAPVAGPRYYLVFPNANGIPATLSYHIPHASLATVNERVVQPPVSSCGDYSGGVFTPFVYTSWGSWLTLNDWPAPGSALAGDHVNYWYSGAPSLTRWQDGFSSLCQSQSESVNTAIEVKPGQRLSNTWDSGPTVPAPAAVPGPDPLDQADPPFGTLVNLAPAQRQDDLAYLDLALGDSGPSHFAALGFPLPVVHDGGASSQLAFWRDGQLVVSSAGAKPFTIWPVGSVLPLLPRAATYRLLWQVSLAVPGASTTTDWSFRSAPAGGGQVPAPLGCGLDTTRPCTYLPLLFPSYQLATDAQSRIAADAPFRVAFRVLHQQGEAAPSGVTADVSVSFNDGKTWTAPVTATASGGEFAATVAIPALAATNGFVSLRVTARDADGNSVTQTTIRALGVRS